MIVEKFSEYNKEFKDGFDFVKSLVKNLDKKGYEYSFAATSIYCFTKDDSSLLFFSKDMYVDYQNKLEKYFIKYIGGYNVYEVDQKLDNPFFKYNRKLESIFYFQDGDYGKRFKKIRYFINKVMATAEEMEHFPVINYDSHKTVTIQCYTHDSNDVTEKDILLADKITKIWNVIK